MILDQVSSQAFLLPHHCGNLMSSFVFSGPGRVPPPTQPPPPPPGPNAAGTTPASTFRPAAPAKLYASPKDLESVAYRPAKTDSHAVCADNFFFFLPNVPLRVEKPYKSVLVEHEQSLKFAISFHLDNDKQGHRVRAIRLKCEGIGSSSQLLQDITFYC